MRMRIRIQLPTITRIHAWYPDPDKQPFRHISIYKNSESLSFYFNQCSRSVTFWYGSGFSDLYLPLTNGSGSWPFRQRPSKCKQKKILFLSFFADYFYKVHLHHSSQIKRQRSNKTVESKVFVLILVDDWRIRICTSDSRIRMAQKLVLHLLSVTIENYEAHRTKNTNSLTITAFNNVANDFF